MSKQIDKLKGCQRRETRGSGGKLTVRQRARSEYVWLGRSKDGCMAARGESAVFARSPGPGPALAHLPGQLRRAPGQDHQDPGLASHGCQVHQRARRLLQGRVSASLLRDSGL